MIAKIIRNRNWKVAGGIKGGIRLQSTAAATPTPPFRTHVAANTPTTQTFYDKDSSTWTYVLHCPRTLQAAVIDPVLDYDSSSGHVSTQSADGLLAHISTSKLDVRHILETHAHADHLTAARYLRHHLHAPVSIGKRIVDVQRTFGPKYNISLESLQGSFDGLLDDGETISLGDCSGSVIHLPGHTPDHVGYVFGGHVFTGDSIFLAPTHTARADFPGGVASQLESSIDRLMSLAGDTKLFVGHDYPADGKQVSCSTTVADQLLLNDHLKMDHFARFRMEKDSSLNTPKLLHPAIQFNIRGGRLPPADEDGVSRMRIPITTKPANHAGIIS
ncbi:hypothetical protein E3P98_02318 [Wallemia ichthyophaga]|nr:hypothetical protein E3P98_02318 [Wallemia ichthyophaga]